VLDKKIKEREYLNQYSVAEKSEPRLLLVIQLILIEKDWPICPRDHKLLFPKLSLNP
jgi:hypothetical protein